MLTLMKFIGVWKVYAITMIYYTIYYNVRKIINYQN